MNCLKHDRKYVPKVSAYKYDYTFIPNMVKTEEVKTRYQYLMSDGFVVARFELFFKKEDELYRQVQLQTQQYLLLKIINAK